MTCENCIHGDHCDEYSGEFYTNAEHNCYGFKDANTFQEVVHCKDCSCKKAVQIGRVMSWRCPYSTVDIDLDGFCHRGLRMKCQ